jgi:DNA ligase (NAD+)
MTQKSNQKPSGNVPATVQKEIEHLRSQLRYHSHRYHVLDSPEISDAAYDELFDRLVEFEAEYPQVVSADSPTQKVGGEASGGFRQVRHHVSMLSLQKVTSEGEFREFDGRVRKMLVDRDPATAPLNYIKLLTFFENRMKNLQITKY